MKNLRDCKIFSRAKTI